MWQRLHSFPYLIEVSAYFDFSWCQRLSAHAFLLKRKKIANPTMPVKGNLVNLYINLACLSGCLFVCLFVCLYPINVKMAEPIGPKFCVGHHVIPGKVYGWSNFQKFASIKIRFLKILKIDEFFFENPRNFFLLFVNKENRCVFYFEYKFLQMKKKMGAKRPKSLERRARSAMNF